MHIKTPVDDNIFCELVHEQLGKDSASGGHKYKSNDEIIGALTKCQYRLLSAMHRGNGKVTSEVLGELVGIAVVAVKASRSYMHNDVANTCSKDIFDIIPPGTELISS